MKLATHIKAAEILAYLRARIESGNVAPIAGYCEVAAAIEWKGGADFGMICGQAMSTLDYACFIAGRPMIGYHMVRVANGAYNPRAWGGIWDKYLSETKDVAANHEWTAEDFDKINKALAGLPDENATRLWASAVKRGDAFIRYNLHKAVLSKPAAN